MTGLPIAGAPSPGTSSGKRQSPKRVRRGGKGRKPSGNPLNQHAAQFSRAHAAGNFAQARTHALNYANASMTAGATGMTAGPASAAPTGSPTQTAPMNANDMGGSTASTHSDGHFIEHMHMKKGALHRELGVPEGQPIPAAKVAKAANSNNPLLAKRARLAETLKKLRK